MNPSFSGSGSRKKKKKSNQIGIYIILKNYKYVKCFVVELAPPYAQSAWGFMRERVRVAFFLLKLEHSQWYDDAKNFSF